MKNRKELIIGIVVVGALVSLFLGIQFLKGINAFNSNRTFYTHYEDIHFLVKGSKIKCQGQQVGVVSDIKFSDNQKELIIEMNITGKTKIPYDSKALLSTNMLSVSEIKLILGENYDSILNVKDTISPKVMRGITETLMESINPIQDKTNLLLNQLNQSLSKMDMALGKDGENITSIMTKVKQSLNTLNSTLKTTDNIMKSSAVDIKNTISNISSITENLKNSNKKVTNLISNFSDISDSLKYADIAGTINSAKDALAGVSKIVDEINNGDGSIHQLIYNKELINNINGMISESEKLIKNIEDHPNRYLHFAVFGRKDKGVKFNKSEEKKLKQILKDTPDQ